MNSANIHQEAPRVEVIIETPRGSFLKRRSTGELDFISPVPCPFNYGSISAFTGLDGDLLDAVVLGPRLPAGTLVRVHARGAIRMIDQGMYDDKLICSRSPISPWQQRLILLFFMIYAKAKSLINLARGHRGRNNCEGWHDAEDALARATLRANADRKGTSIT
ncbi:inorganic diphosphatase [Methylobacter sp. YRD-M1]|nr:inorganic diphosphatase [Methylobacter sp. YRD-M1]